MSTYSDNTVAVIRGDCCVRSSGHKLDEFVLQPAIQKVYADVEVTKQQLEEYVDTSIGDTREELKDYTKLLSIILPMASKPQCSTTKQINNPEWKLVIVDGEDKILCGVNAEDVPIFYATPSEIIDCVQKSYNPYYVSSYQSAIALALSKLPSTTTESPEWDFVILDAEDKVLFGVKVDGTSWAYISAEELWQYTFDSLTIS